MNKLERGLHAVLNLIFRRRDIIIDGELYLRRWFLTPRSWKKRVFLHCILRPDEQTHLHDHPFDFTSLMLKGGYSEVFAPHAGRNRIKHIPDFKDCACDFCWKATRVVRPGNIVRNKAEHLHAVKPLRGAVWTILLVSHARRDWGFWTDKGWVDWRTHLGLQNAPDHLEDKL